MCFSGMLDIERLTAKTVYGSANAKDLRAICQSISLLPRIKEIIAPLKTQRYIGDICLTRHS